MRNAYFLYVLPAVSICVLFTFVSCTSIFTEAAGNREGASGTSEQAGATVSSPSYTNDDLELASTTNGTTTTFTVKSGYSIYCWYFDTALVQSGTDNAWALDSAGTSPTVSVGEHQVLVVATISGKANSSSATCTYTYKNQ